MAKHGCHYFATNDILQRTMLKLALGTTFQDDDPQRFYPFTKGYPVLRKLGIFASSFDDTIKIPSRSIRVSSLNVQCHIQ
jgi:hypothetical protein